jgi:CSLREA domain-containing protein
MSALARAFIIFKGKQFSFIAFALLSTLFWAVSVQANTYTVTKTDDHDDTVCDADCTLREAINAANANIGADTIEFSIPALGQSCSNSVCTIALSNSLGALPALTDNATTLNGLSQETNQASNCQATSASAGPPCIVIDGTNVVASANGLDISSNSNSIKGLIIVNLTGHGIKITGDENTVTQTYVGVAADGTTGAGNDSDGINIDPSDDNIIGPGNVIGSNAGDGLEIDGDRNEVISNIIGLGADGTTELGNTLNGVRITGAWSTGNCIGGQDSDNGGAGSCAPVAGSGPFSGSGNIISKNGENGVFIADGTGANSIFGNFIGLSQAGTADKGNTLSGILSSGATVTGNLIGGDTVANIRFRNVISGNDEHGIKFSSNSGNHTVRGNYIGTNATGTAAVANGFDGINIDPSHNNIIGGNVATNPGYRNLISGNTGHGITIDASDATIILGNYIGTLANGSCGIPNGNDGIHIQNGATDNLIGASLGTNGSAALGLGNKIACNTGDGVEVDGATTIRNFIRTNAITQNGEDGIELSNGANNDIAAPTVTAIGSMSGTSALGTDVDAYSDTNGEGAIYHGTDTADTNCGATCEFFVSGAISGPNGTATASHAAFGTSAFSVPLSANLAPVVNAGPNKVIHAGNPVTQSGSFVDSNAGQTHTILWEIDGVAPNTAGCTISGPTDLLNVTIDTVTGPGVCTAKLTVTDSGAPGLVGISTFQINTTNNAPFFASPVNQTGSPGQSFVLNSGAVDHDGDSLFYTWSLPNGPGSADCSLASPTNNSTVLVNTNSGLQGTCDVKVEVTDWHLLPPGSFVSTQVKITTVNHPPVANAGPDQSVHAGKPVTIQGSATDQDPGQTLTFTWTLPNGAGTAGCSFGGTINTSKVTVNTTTGGTCVVRLAVTDSIFNATTDDMLVTATNNLPFFASPVNQTLSAGQSVVLSANAQDPDKDTLSFLWSLVGANTAGCSLPGPNTNGTVLVKTSAVGTCTVKIEVNDGHGGSASTQVTITTTNQAPSVNAGPDQIVGVGQSVTLVAVASDLDNNTLTFAWSLPNGAGTAGCSFVGSTTNSSVIVQTSALGSCLVQVDVSDGQGGSASDQVLITTTTAPTCNVTATASATTLKIAKNWARIIRITVVNAANSTGTATINAIEAIVGKNLIVTAVKVGNKRLSLPFNINLPPGTQQIFSVRLKSLVKQTVNDPFVKVSGVCNNANFIVPVSSDWKVVPAHKIISAVFDVRVQSDHIVAAAMGQGIERIQIQLFDPSGRLILSTTANGRSLGHSFSRENSDALVNGVYLVLILAQDSQGRVIKSQIRKLALIH